MNWCVNNVTKWCHYRNSFLFFSPSVSPVCSIVLHKFFCLLVRSHSERWRWMIQLAGKNVIMVKWKRRSKCFLAYIKSHKMLQKKWRREKQQQQQQQRQYREIRLKSQYNNWKYLSAYEEKNIYMWRKQQFKKRKKRSRMTIVGLNSHAFLKLKMRPLFTWSLRFFFLSLRSFPRGHSNKARITIEREAKEERRKKLHENARNGRASSIHFKVCK